MNREKPIKNLGDVAEHIKKEGFPSDEQMRADLEQTEENKIPASLHVKVAEYNNLFNKWKNGTASEKETSMMLKLKNELEELNKKAEKRIGNKFVTKDGYYIVSLDGEKAEIANKYSDEKQYLSYTELGIKRHTGGVDGRGIKEADVDWWSEVERAFAKSMNEKKEHEKYTKREDEKQ